MKQLKKLQAKMQVQIEKRFQERQIMSHEVDTTNIDSLFEIYNDLGGVGIHGIGVE